jgi:hypothetical protein
MTANEDPDQAPRIRVVPDLSVPATAAPVAAETAAPPISRPMPRLGRGIVWSDIVAEIERDHADRMRDAA